MSKSLQNALQFDLWNCVLLEIWNKYPRLFWWLIYRHLKVSYLRHSHNDIQVESKTCTICRDVESRDQIGQPIRTYQKNWIKNVNFVNTDSSVLLTQLYEMLQIISVVWNTILDICHMHCGNWGLSHEYYNWSQLISLHKMSLLIRNVWNTTVDVCLTECFNGSLFHVILQSISAV